MDKALAVIANS